MAKHPPLHLGEDFSAPLRTLQTLQAHLFAAQTWISSTEPHRGPMGWDSMGPVPPGLRHSPVLAAAMVILRNTALCGQAFFPFTPEKPHIQILT